MSGFGRDGGLFRGDSWHGESKRRRGEGMGRNGGGEKKRGAICNWKRVTAITKLTGEG